MVYVHSSNGQLDLWIPIRSGEELVLKDNHLAYDDDAERECSHGDIKYVIKHSDLRVSGAEVMSPIATDQSPSRANTSPHDVRERTLCKDTMYDPACKTNKFMCTL
jgi:hypothetical protein